MTPVNNLQEKLTPKSKTGNLTGDMDSALRKLPEPLVGDTPYPWLWIGTWSMGGAGYGRAHEPLCIKTLELAFRHGIRHFDTAGFYAKGNSERILSKALGHVRKEVFISTKGGLVWHGNRVLHEATPSSLKSQLVESLKRLGTDYIDLYQLHWPDPKVDISESLDALRDLKEKGLIRSYGAGNLTLEQLKRFISIGENIPFELPFNPIRKSNLKILQEGYQNKRTINLIVSPFEQGLLANKRFFDTKPGKKDIRSRNPFFHCNELRSILYRYFDFIDKAESINGLKPVFPATVNILWLLTHEEVDVVIPGPRTPEQLREILKATVAIDRLCHSYKQDPLAPITDSFIITPKVRREILNVLKEALGEGFLHLLDKMGGLEERCKEKAP